MDSSDSREPAPYLAGLRLHGRQVVVVGAGRVLSRRLSTLLASGPFLRVVSPEATPRVQAAADAGIRDGGRPVRIASSVKAA